MGAGGDGVGHGGGGGVEHERGEHGVVGTDELLDVLADVFGDVHGDQFGDDADSPGGVQTQAVFWDDISIEGEMTCAGTRMSYYPYGQEMGTVTANDTAKFGTYTRDAATGLDYAMNRYYQSTWGRFTSPDPYMGSASPETPSSWNRYSYVGGDPVNATDSTGLIDESCANPNTFRYYGPGDGLNQGGCSEICVSAGSPRLRGTNEWQSIKS